MPLSSSTLKKNQIFVRHIILKYPHSLQHGQDSYMGVIPVKVVVLYALFQGNVSVEILIKEGERCTKTAEAKNDF